MDFETLRAAFFDELAKIAGEKLTVPKERIGRRSISVDKLLKKDKEGTLFKSATLSGGSVIPFVGKSDPAAARGKRKGDLPSYEDVDVVAREDGRDFASTVPATHTTLTIGQTNTGN